MSAINTGAYVNGVHPKTKKALRDALKSDPTSVTLDATSLYDRNGHYLLTPGMAFIVVGPDPYTKRDWYARIDVNRLGNIKIT